MYSTPIRELVHKDEMNDGDRRSNKNQGAHPFLSHYGRQHTLGTRLQRLDIVLNGQNVVEIEAGQWPGDSGCTSENSPRRAVQHQHSQRGVHNRQHQL